MGELLFPSSLQCDCGDVSLIFERTVRGLAKMHQRKIRYPADSAPDEHLINLIVDVLLR